MTDVIHLTQFGNGNGFGASLAASVRCNLQLGNVFVGGRRDGVASDRNRRGALSAVDSYCVLHR